MRVDVNETIVGVRSGLDDNVGELVLVKKADYILGHFEMAVSPAVKRHDCAKIAAFGNSGKIALPLLEKPKLDSGLDLDFFSNGDAEVCNWLLYVVVLNQIARG